MEPVTPESASNQQSDVEKYARGFSRQQRRELQNQFETGLQWLEQEPPAYDRALGIFAQCMQADPMGAVYTFEFLQALEQGYELGLYKHGWRQRRRNLKLVSRIEQLCENQQWHEALQQAPDALYHNARHERLLLELAFAAQSIEAVETQWTYLEFALKYFSGSCDVHVQIVHAFYQSGRFDDANDHMFHVAKSADDHLLQQILRALPGVITQQFPGRELISQIASLRLELEQNPSHETTWERLCQILEELNLYGQAIEAAQLAQQATSNTNSWSQKSLQLRLQQAESRLHFHLELQAPDSLLDDLQHEVWRIRTEYFLNQAKQFPNQARAEIQLGWCLTGTKNWYEAIRQFERIEADHCAFTIVEEIALQLGLAESQQAIRRFDDALGTFTKLLELLTQCKQPDEVDEELSAQFPGLENESGMQRSLKRIKTLAASMNQTALSQKCDDLAQKIVVSTDN